MTNSGQLRALQADQRRRWQQGEHVPVEWYLEEQPALRDDPDGVLDLIYNEIVLQEEHGQEPRLEDFVRRFPHLDTQLRLQFEVHEALEQTHITTCEEPAPADGLRGPSVAGYDIKAEIGRGGMGVVYRAVQVALKRPVALKMILAGAHAGPRERLRFRTEAEAAARLQHPNIVQIYEVGEQDSCLFLALELVDGVSLDRHFADRPPPPRQAAELVETLARAVHYAHSRGVIHRDLKPANVLLKNADCRFEIADCKSAISNLQSAIPKITDFGLAKLLDATIEQTPPDAFLGTPSYMAPEQATGKSQDIGPATDVYSLGTILYELLTGRPPFQGETAPGILDQVRSQEPVAPRYWRPTVPPDLQTICLKCLEKEPDRRYTSAEALADDLGRFLAGEPIHARPVTAPERLVKWVRRRPAVSMLIVVSLVAMVASVFGWQVNERRSAEQRAAAAAQKTYERFRQLRDEAFFRGIQGTLIADSAAVRNLRSADESARQALALMGVTIDGQGGPDSPASLSAPENDDIQSSCYQLLSLLAEITWRGGGNGPGPDKARARQALAILDRAARLRPETAALALQRARYLHQLGKEADAAEARARAETLQPVTALDYFLRGWEQLRSNNAAQASADFTTAHALRPDDYWPQFSLACALLRSGHPESAVEWLTRCAKVRPEIVWTYLLRADAHAARGAFDRAETDYESAERLHPKPDEAYALYLSRGRMRLERRQWADAADDLRHAIALDPRRAEPYLDLALAYEGDGLADQGAWQEELALRRGPGRVALTKYYYQRSTLLYDAGKPEDALRACALALAASPDFAAAYNLRGRILLQLRRYPEAAAAFDRFLMRGGIAGADFYCNRARARVKSGDYLGAVDDYTDALKRTPAADLYAERGWANFFADACRFALRDFEEALRRDPKNTDAHVGRGLAHVSLGQVKEAMRDAEEALRREPSTPEMRFNIACIYGRAADQVPEAEAADYRRRALNALRQTLDLIPSAERPTFWRTRVVPDPYLASIRNLPQFQAWARTYADFP